MTTKNPFFKAEDLQNFEMTITGVNSTSSVPFSAGALQLTEILEDGIWIEVPLRSCSMGHSLRLEISGKRLWKKTNEYIKHDIQIQGVIEEIEGHSEDGQQVRLKFRQYSIEEWDNLLSFLTEEQTSINALIKRTRK